MVGLLLLPAIFFCRRAVNDWENGCLNQLHPRANPVNPASVLHLPISDEADIPSEDLRALERHAPFGYRAEVLMQRADSIAAATETFDDLCLNGWTSDTYNQYDRSEFTYGGEGDQRFCASQVIQRRFYMGYVPLCGSSRNYYSYVLVQRGDVVLAAYEATTSWANTGQDTNQALSAAMRQLR